LAVLASDIGSNSRKKFIGGFADLFVGCASRRSVAQELLHVFPKGENVSRTLSRLEHVLSHHHANDEFKDSQPCLQQGQVASFGRPSQTMLNRLTKVGRLDHVIVRFSTLPLYVRAWPSRLF
jgi:hypothetical protein